MTFAHSRDLVAEGGVTLLGEPCRTDELVGDAREGGDHDYGRFRARCDYFLDLEYAFGRTDGRAAELEYFHLVFPGFWDAKSREIIAFFKRKIRQLFAFSP